LARVAAVGQSEELAVARRRRTVERCQTWAGSPRTFTVILKNSFSVLASTCLCQLLKMRTNDTLTGVFSWSRFSMLSKNAKTIRTPRLLRGNSYLWHVRVVIYKRPTTDCICRIYQVIETPTPRWTFEIGMREAAVKALAVLRHEADEQMAHSQYHHFPS
jgi:hypothetical protein